MWGTILTSQNWVVMRCCFPLNLSALFRWWTVERGSPAKGSGRWQESSVNTFWDYEILCLPLNDPPSEKAIPVQNFIACLPKARPIFAGPFGPWLARTANRPQLLLHTPLAIPAPAPAPAAAKTRCPPAGRLQLQVCLGLSAEEHLISAAPDVGTVLLPCVNTGTTATPDSVFTPFC